MRTRVTKTEVPQFTTSTVGLSPSTWNCKLNDWNYGRITQVSTWTLPTQSNHLYSENSYIIDETTPKYLDIVINGITNQVPAFKYVKSVKAFNVFEQGSPQTLTVSQQSTKYCSGDSTVKTVPRIWKIQTSGAPTDDWDRVQLNADYLITKGVVLPPISIENYMATNGSSILKSILSETDSLLGFQDSFNVLNFIAELKDIRRFPELVKKWTKSAHDVSDKFLGVEFGLLPFKSDILAITDRLQHTGPFIDKWNDMAKNSAVSNLHRNITTLVTGLPVDHAADSPNKGYAVIEGNFKPTHNDGTSFLTGMTALAHSCSSHDYRLLIKVTAHIYYVPVTIPDDLIDNIKRAIWGLDKPLEAIWNALPFSFVADWFANVGDLISDFERAEPLLTMKIVNSGYSISYKLESRNTIVTKFGTNTNLSSFGTSDAGKLTSYYDYYLRSRIDPSTILVASQHYGPLRFKSINQSQALLGSALLHQLLR